MSSNACSLTAPAQPGVARLVQLLPARGVSRTFNYVDHFAFWRVVGWLRKRHLGLSMYALVRRFLPGWTIREGGIELLRPSKIAIERYRFRGTRIPTPWSGIPTS